MERNEVLKKVNDIAKDVFDNDCIALNEETTAADIEEWDSLTHLNLVSDIEEEFGITFTLTEITESESVGAMLDAIIKHISADK